MNMNISRYSIAISEIIFDIEFVSNVFNCVIIWSKLPKNRCNGDCGLLMDAVNVWFICTSRSGGIIVDSELISAPVEYMLSSMIGIMIMSIPNITLRLGDFMCLFILLDIRCTMYPQIMLSIILFNKGVIVMRDSISSIVRIMIPMCIFSIIFLSIIILLSIYFFFWFRLRRGGIC